MTAVPAPAFELAYFPYLGLRGVQELRFGRASVWNAALLADRVADPAIRARIEALLAMNRTTAHDVRGSRPIEDIGIATVGERNFTPLNGPQGKDLRELRYALFLCGLAQNTRLNGPNAGHMAYTSENFDLVRQTFDLDGDFFAENTGVIVRFRFMGYRVAETRFPKPSYVPEPIAFKHDEELLKQLSWVKRCDRRLFRRILRAAAVFLESYHNTAAVDMGARILLQASSFEILLDLPDQGQRKAFKDLVEQFTNNRADRRYRYKFEAPSGSKPDSRSLKGIWADRFYTLRNHIIHGEQVREGEYLFRKSHHHLLVAAIFFVFLVKRLIDGSRERKGLKPAFFERIDWTQLRQADEYERELNGFKLSPDFARLYGLE